MKLETSKLHGKQITYAHRMIKQEIWANAHETRHSISL